MASRRILRFQSPNVVPEINASSLILISPTKLIQSDFCKTLDTFFPHKNHVWVVEDLGSNRYRVHAPAPWRAITLARGFVVVVAVRLNAVPDVLPFDAGLAPLVGLLTIVNFPSVLRSPEFVALLIQDFADLRDIIASSLSPPSVSFQATVEICSEDLIPSEQWIFHRQPNGEKRRHKVLFSFAPLESNNPSFQRRPGLRWQRPRQAPTSAPPQSSVDPTCQDPSSLPSQVVAPKSENSPQPSPKSYATPLPDVMIPSPPPSFNDNSTQGVVFRDPVSSGKKRKHQDGKGKGVMEDESDNSDSDSDLKSQMEIIRRNEEALHTYLMEQKRSSATSNMERGESSTAAVHPVPLDGVLHDNVCMEELLAVIPPSEMLASPPSAQPHRRSLRLICRSLPSAAERRQLRRNAGRNLEFPSSRGVEIINLLEDDSAPERDVVD